jgi:hypothetical protein
MNNERTGSPFYHKYSIQLRQGQEAEQLAWQAHLDGDTAAADHFDLVAEGHFAFAEADRRRMVNHNPTPTAKPAVARERMGQLIAFPTRPQKIVTAPAPKLPPQLSPMERLLREEAAKAGIPLLELNQKTIEFAIAKF